MPDYTSDPTAAEIAEAQAYILNTALNDTAVWRSVAYVPDGRGGSTRTFTDNTIPVWVRNPGSKPTNYVKASGETVYEWEFICRLSDAIQPKDVLQYQGNDIEVVYTTQRGTASFAQVVYGKRVGA